MNTKDFSYDWASLPNHLIIEGVANDGTRLLKLMLSDYVKLTNEKVDATCPTCLNNYINHLKKYIYMQNTENKEKRNYKLHLKRIPMSLEFGTDEFITNENLTDEKALALIDKYSKLENAPEDVLSFLFSEYPAESPKKAEGVKPPATPKETAAQKKKRLEEEEKAKAKVKEEAPVIDLVKTTETIENTEVVEPIIEPSEEDEDEEEIVPVISANDEIIDLDVE